MDVPLCVEYTVAIPDSISGKHVSFVTHCLCAYAFVIRNIAIIFNLSDLLKIYRYI